MKYWAFDLDGTLVDSLESYFVNLRELFKSKNITLTQDQLKVCLTMPLSHFLAVHLPADQVPAAYETMKEKSVIDADKVLVFEGIQNLLIYLQQKNFGLALWTAREKESTDAILKHTGLEKYFDIVVTGSCVSKPKPDPEGLLKIMAHYACEKNEITMVGDHDVDMIAANTAQVRPIRVSYRSNYDVGTEHKVCAISHKQFFEVSEFQQWLDQK